jgi:hypothetical protein
MANSGMIVNLVQDRNFKKLLHFFNDDELIVAARVLIADCFIIIAKNMGLRKLFFKRELLNAISSSALLVVEE